jgi:hypothetical protein
MSSGIVEQVEVGLRDWACADYLNISMPDEWSTRENGWELTVGNILVNPMPGLDSEIYSLGVTRFAKLAPLSVAPWIDSLAGASKEYAATVLCFLYQLTDGFGAKLTPGQKLKVDDCCAENASDGDIARWEWLRGELNRASEGVLRER